MRVLDFDNCKKCPVCRKIENISHEIITYCKALEQYINDDMSECPFPQEQEVEIVQEVGLFFCEECEQEVCDDSDYCMHCGVKFKKH